MDHAIIVPVSISTVLIKCRVGGFFFPLPDINLYTGCFEGCMSKHTGTFCQRNGVGYRSVDYVMTSTGGNP